MKKLIFAQIKNEPRNVENRVRLSSDALAAVRLIANSTGQKIGFVASEMIKFAIPYTVVKGVDEVAFLEETESDE